ncbi:hypothetical protein MD588_15465 [Photobacterium sp. SDRW27]|nr:hypothetical protein [Photobacterium obscurum]MCW8330208.1 hypothetical protein [Photobacterium obscurum]
MKSENLNHLSPTLGNVDNFRSRKSNYENDFDHALAVPQITFDDSTLEFI